MDDWLHIEYKFPCALCGRIGSTTNGGRQGWIELRDPCGFGSEPICGPCRVWAEQDPTRAWCVILERRQALAAIDWRDVDELADAGRMRDAWKL